jgi:hypothetical protein
VKSKAHYITSRMFLKSVQTHRRIRNVKNQHNTKNRIYKLAKHGYVNGHDARTVDRPVSITTHEINRTTRTELV